MTTQDIVLGLDIGGTKISSGLNNKGKIFERKEIKTPYKDSQEAILDTIAAQIATYLPNKFKAIGIGIPGLVDPDQGVVYNLANIPSFQKVGLKTFLEDRFKVPVVVNNDANCFTLGEFCFGTIKHLRHVVGITLGTGIGTGIIANGHLYTGYICGAGEWGGVPFKDSTFEDYCSSKFFKNEYGESAKQLAKAAEKGDENALGSFREYGKNLGLLINRILFTYSPEAIVIGGSIRKAFPYFEESMKETLSEFPYKSISENVRVYVSELDDSAILGAIALVEESAYLLSENNYKTPSYY
ncbi:ROK family protein [Pleomorphovibrio marinus]|uniref:ROK family protein n=1 Tax=Pleomorphovibrio marinus TaxID=2164132 RepID=UPI000E0BEE2C|nr:ROK family protein [Pleomorphovibrio marinus]